MYDNQYERVVLFTNIYLLRRKREGETDRQTDEQTERQIDRQTDRQRDRQTDR